MYLALQSQICFIKNLDIIVSTLFFAKLYSLCSNVVKKSRLPNVKFSSSITRLNIFSTNSQTDGQSKKDATVFPDFDQAHLLCYRMYKLGNVP
jgi:hypothetical protein